MINLKLPQNKTDIYIKKFFKHKRLNFLLKEANNKRYSSSNDFKPKLIDLYRIYQFIILNKRTTILEFGSGWSSLIMFMALNELKKKYYKESSKLRNNNLFEIFILENKKKYLNISKKRISNYIKEEKITNYSKLNYNFSTIQMTQYSDKYATEYKKIPLCNPDFIYLDGPGHLSAKNSINGFTTNHPNMMPMVCDILKMEYFLTPGTIIVCDGRASNAQFMRDHFKRKWKYINDKKNNQHLFILIDEILGKYNERQIEFYNT
tara:strand:- start:5551 stop:6339 length:789 start_codon:yes stop_codon:yes gene_type:complete